MLRVGEEFNKEQWNKINIQLVIIVIVIITSRRSGFYIVEERSALAEKQTWMLRVYHHINGSER